MLLVVGGGLVIPRWSISISYFDFFVSLSHTAVKNHDGWSWTRMSQSLLWSSACVGVVSPEITMMQSGVSRIPRHGASSPALVSPYGRSRSDKCFERFRAHAVLLHRVRYCLRSHEFLERIHIRNVRDQTDQI